MTNFIRAFSLVFLIGSSVHAAPMSFDVNSSYSETPVAAHKFYTRVEMVAYCSDHGMTFTSERDACAKPYRSYCAVAYPYDGRYDRREAAAICNYWKPHFRAWF